MENNKGCFGCIYFKKIFDSRTYIMACHYILDTGVKRGCDVVGCDKKKLIRDRRKTNAVKKIKNNSIISDQYSHVLFDNQLLKYTKAAIKTGGA